MTNKQENKGCRNDTLKKIFEEIETNQEEMNDIYEKKLKFPLYEIGPEFYEGLNWVLIQIAKGYIQRTKEELEFLENISQPSPIPDINKRIQNCKEIIKSGEENGIE